MWLYAEFPEFYKEMTIYHEIVDDAVFAVEYLLGDLRIDPEQVYVMGHTRWAEMCAHYSRAPWPGKGCGNHYDGRKLPPPSGSSW